MRLKEGLNPKPDMFKTAQDLGKPDGLLSALSVCCTSMCTSKLASTTLQCNVLVQRFCLLLQFSLIATAFRLIILKISDRKNVKEKTQDFSITYKAKMIVQ